MQPPSSLNISYRPTVLLAGEPQPDLDAALFDLTIDDRLGSAGRLRAIFNNWGLTPSGPGLLFDEAFTGNSRAIRVKSAETTVFDGEITGIEAIFAEGRPPAIAVTASASPRDFREKAKTRRLGAMNDADAFKALARENGLMPDIKLLRSRTADVAQNNETDYAFVVRRAAQVGAETWLQQETLHVVDSGVRPAPTLTLGLGDALLQFSGSMAPTSAGWTEAAPKTGAGVAADSPTLQTGGRVALQGVGPAFGGAYYIARVEHTFNLTRGFQSAFEAARLWPQPTG